MKPRNRRVLRTLVAASVLSAAALFAFPASASAWVDPNCYARLGGPVVLYWGQGQTGANICLNGTIYDMANPATYFSNNGTGGGQRVWNNAGSGLNLDTGYWAIIWSNPGYTGASYGIAACCDQGSAPYRLGDVTNRNRSLSWRPYP